MSQVSTTAEQLRQFECTLMDEIRRVLGSNGVTPGFDSDSRVLQLEENDFPTSFAVAAFARAAGEKLSPEEKQRQKTIIERLLASLKKAFKEEELTGRCLDVSQAISHMLNHLGVWAVTYCGTLLYEATGNEEDRTLYYVQDLVHPPPSGDARGHAWVFTPVFPVIDFTAKFQGLTAYLHNAVPLLRRRNVLAGV